jgi:D-aminoacyl-tRNA deacylase
LPVLIVASKRDPAAQNIAKELTRIHDLQALPDTPGNLLRQGDVFLSLVETDGVHTNSLQVDFTVDAVIFASRHRSESGEPTLTVHWPGNPTSKAELGGDPKSLSFTDPPRLRSALLGLDEARAARNLDYTVSLEATHHGPTELPVPCLFVEIGSTEGEWNDTRAGGAVAEAIWKAATKPVPGKNAIGFGGGHYCNKQSMAIRKDGYAFSHIFSKYFFDEYDEEMVRMAFNRTRGECRAAVIDWKGVRGPERARLLQTLKELEIEVVRV